eukprot:10657146-Alexandrium_andersonii.AAC.1
MFREDSTAAQHLLSQIAVGSSNSRALTLGLSFDSSLAGQRIARGLFGLLGKAQLVDAAREQTQSGEG